MPLTSTTTFESEFTQDFRDSAAQNQPQPGVTQNIPADLVVRPSADGQAFDGQATAQYAIVDVQSGEFSSAQETVILALKVLDATTDADGVPRATRLAVSVTYAAHDFEPCSGLCGRQSFDDLKQTVTATATRTS